MDKRYVILDFLKSLKNEQVIKKINVFIFFGLGLIDDDFFITFWINNWTMNNKVDRKHHDKLYDNFIKIKLLEI